MACCEGVGSNLRSTVDSGLRQRGWADCTKLHYGTCILKPKHHVIAINHYLYGLSEFKDKGNQTKQK